MAMNSVNPSQLGKYLDGFVPDPMADISETLQKALFLARHLQERATALQTPQEYRQQAELDRMLQHPEDKATLVQITDQAFRSSVPHRVADQLIHILDVQGIPRFFSRFDRAMLRGFQSFGGYLPGVAVPLVKEKMHHETANVILPAEREMLTEHLQRRRKEGVRMNVNYLGEALLGEEEAERRLKAYQQALQLPEIEVISVKISTIYSQISPLAREHTIDQLCDRMELLYLASAKTPYVRRDGQQVPKFVYLDMEEYRDLQLTAEVFMRTLDRPGLETIGAGIALQAYIPDSYAVQKRINDWARQRVAAGGHPVTIRLVKGANMEMEQVEASIRGWPQAPFRTKVATDANFKRMLHQGLEAENLAAVRLGVASHNLFDVAYALVLAEERKALDRVQFEMLEGMANHQRRALFEVAQNLLLYAPACYQRDFIHAIGYLIRRLDENTGEENFLRHTFKLKVDSSQWRELERGFLDSFAYIQKLTDDPRRIQNRGSENPVTGVSAAEFKNEPDTDFSLLPNVQWAESLIDSWSDRHGNRATDIPLVIDGRDIYDDRTTAACFDPSRPDVVVGRYRPAVDADIQTAVGCAKSDPDHWRSRTPRERAELLRAAALQIRAARADLMGAALADAGKTLTESDPEVSEAVDFVEFYSRTAERYQTDARWQTNGKGVVAVVPPWNFPIAIPCGGVAAALAAGNTVILKPASDAVLPAYVLCQCFWRAGISKRVLQFAPCSGSGAGQTLVTHDDVDVVILTGGTETALSMLSHKPQMNLLAETGGKNATIVTAMSDRDLAIKNVLHSAFSHSGQKCSATSLLILEQEVYDDPQFRRTLCDAVESLHVGSAWDLKTKVGPLIRPPSGVLETAFKELEPGESWAVMPHPSPDNPHLYSPAVKWDVRPGSFTHNTEFFGPVLGVMKARNLDEAIHFVNATGYGLTSGLESLDDREQAIWRDAIRAGNLYINRPTTGAIVLRQPFGGMGKSAFGPGIKAGGPNYVVPLMDWRDPPPSSADKSMPLEVDDEHVAALCEYVGTAAVDEHDVRAADIRRLTAAVESYAAAMADEFGVAHDDFELIGQDNFRRYLPAGAIRIRVESGDSWFDVFARVVAAKLAGCRSTVSYPPDVDDATMNQLHDATEQWAGAVEFVEESDDRLATIVAAGQTDRLRYAAADRVSMIVRSAAAQAGVFIADAPVLAQGRIELLWYLREQSISHDYHRYGNLGGRSSESRKSKPL